ncbi:LOW QUALITY PROTEIN: cdc7 kinase [Cochliomyia hominivorax]
MDRKLRKSANLKGYNNLLPASGVANATAMQSDNCMQNSYVIPTTASTSNTTSMSPVILPPPPANLVKDIAGLNQYHSPRTTRQRTNNNANYNINTALVTATTTTATTPLQLTQQEQLQMTTTIEQKNHNNNNSIIISSNNMNNNQTTLMSSKAAACIASPMEQLAAVHAKATSSRNKNEEAINDLKTRIPEIENIFDIHSRIGNGTFSTVLLGTLKKQRDLPDNQKRKFAIKHHIPTSHPDRIMKELQCMAKIGGTDNVGEGKRTREHDDVNAKKSIEGAVAVTGAGEVVSGNAKRLRCSAPTIQEQQLQGTTGPTTRAANAANTGTLTHTPFKMPLKQINEIPNTPPIGSKGAVANVGKSAAQTMSSRLQQKLRAQGGAEHVNHSSTRTSSAGGGAAGKNTPPITQNANSNNNNNNSSIDAKYNTNRNLSTSNSPKCYCYGNPQVCNICLVKKEIHASRAGTPGYRPPEVLLKYPDQTTAVDVWASGVIFLSVLSSVYPFFKAPNDYVALAEMITIFGDKAIRKTAFILDRLVTLSQKTKPLDLRKLCVRFRNRAKFSSPELLKKYQRTVGTCEVCKNCDQFFFNCLCMESPFVTESLDDDDIFPPSAYDLLYRLLEVNPHKRITADEALRHPFFMECYNNNNNITTSNATSNPETTLASTAAAVGDSAATRKSLN